MSQILLSEFFSWILPCFYFYYLSLLCFYKLFEYYYFLFKFYYMIIFILILFVFEYWFFCKWKMFFWCYIKISYISMFFFNFTIQIFQICTHKHTNSYNDNDERHVFIWMTQREIERVIQIQFYWDKQEIRNIYIYLNEQTNKLIVT